MLAFTDVAVGVGVAVAVAVGVAVGVLVGVPVADGVLVGVGVLVGDGVSVAVGDGVGVRVGVGVDVSVGVTSGSMVVEPLAVLLVRSVSRVRPYGLTTTLTGTSPLKPVVSQGMLTDAPPPFLDRLATKSLPMYQSPQRVPR